jgi:hypothetical protein
VIGCVVVLSEGWLYCRYCTWNNKLRDTQEGEKLPYIHLISGCAKVCSELKSDFMGLYKSSTFI